MQILLSYTFYKLRFLLLFRNYDIAQIFVFNNCCIFQPWVIVSTVATMQNVLKVKEIQGVDARKASLEMESGVSVRRRKIVIIIKRLRAKRT